MFPSTLLMFKHLHEQEHTNNIRACLFYLETYSTKYFPHFNPFNTLHEVCYFALAVNS